MRQEFAQEIENTAKSVINDIHTALPGKIISFDVNSCTAIVKPIGKYVTSDGKVLDYPNISEVPIVFPYCIQSGVGIAFPVRKGDSCLIIISEVELDEWRSGAESEGSLRFDLTNAIAIPGLMHTGNTLISNATSMNAVVIGTSKGATITVSNNGIAVRGDLTVSGNIKCTGDVKSGQISLTGHTHISGEPGTSTGNAK